jgi:hypothetical protein
MYTITMTDILFGFDLDGVVANTYGVMCDKINTTYDLNYCPVNNPMPYDPYTQEPKITKDGLMSIFNALVIGQEVPFMDGAIEVLSKYYEKTNRLVFITHRNNRDVVQKTREWINQGIKLPYELYACYKCEKAALAKDLEVGGFFDDLPDVCDNFMEEGLIAYLFQAPWHIYVENLTPYNIVHSWEDISKILL